MEGTIYFRNDRFCKEVRRTAKQIICVSIDLAGNEQIRPGTQKPYEVRLNARNLAEIGTRSDFRGWHYWIAIDEPFALAAAKVAAKQAEAAVEREEQANAARAKNAAALAAALKTWARKVDLPGLAGWVSCALADENGLEVQALVRTAQADCYNDWERDGDDYVEFKSSEFEIAYTQKEWGSAQYWHTNVTRQYGRTAVDALAKAIRQNRWQALS